MRAVLRVVVLSPTTGTWPFFLVLVSVICSSHGFIPQLLSGVDPNEGRGRKQQVCETSCNIDAKLSMGGSVQQR